MKSVFDTCCNAPPQVVGPSGTATSPAPADMAMKQGTPSGQQTGAQRVTQPVSDFFQKVEEKMPMMAPMAEQFRQMISPTAAPELDRLNANLVTGKGETKQSFGEAITRHSLPVVGVFPANSKCGLATLRALTSFPYRNSCARILCVVRNPDRIAQVRAELGNHVTDAVAWAFADCKDEAEMTSAFVGLDRLLIVPPNTEDRADLTCNALNAAKFAGVKHIVLLSMIAAQHPNTLFGRQFRSMEICLEEMRGYSNCTIMRMAWFMDNFLDMAPDLIGNNRFLASWGPSGVAPVALADIGRASAAVLSASTANQTHYNRMYHLTGPESLSGFRMAEVFTKVFGRTITYQDLPREEMKRIYIEQLHVPEWQAEGYVEMNDLFKSGAASAWSTDIPMLTGGNHTTLERFLQSKRWYFTGNRSPLTVLFPASGRVGGHTLEALLKDSIHSRIRAVVHSLAKCEELQSKYASDSKIEFVEGDFEKHETVRNAMEGADTVVIIPPEKLERFSDIDTAIKMANDSGAFHTILFSVSKAFDATALGRKFNAWERVLMDNSRSFTVVQSTVFFDMMFSFAEQIKQPEHKVHHWLGTGRFCPVDSRDVGEALAAVIREGPLVHHAQTYSLYGPQMLSFGDMCETLSRVLGYKIESYPDVTSDQVRVILRDKLPSFSVEEVIQAHETLARGTDIAMSPDLLKLVGRARTIQAFFEDYKSRFTGPPTSPTVTGADKVQTQTVYYTTTTSTLEPSTVGTTDTSNMGTTSTSGEASLPPPAMAPTESTTKSEYAEAKPGAAAIPIAPTQPVVES